jgi:hypothetical protein
VPQAQPHGGKPLRGLPHPLSGGRAAPKARRAFGPEGEAVTVVKSSTPPNFRTACQLCCGHAILNPRRKSFFKTATSIYIKEISYPYNTKKRNIVKGMARRFVDSIFNNVIIIGIPKNTSVFLRMPFYSGVI